MATKFPLNLFINCKGATVIKNLRRLLNKKQIVVVNFPHFSRRTLLLPRLLGKQKSFLI